MTPEPEPVRFLDHTADVGFRVEAPTRAELFLRAAAGLRALLQGEEEGAGEDGALVTEERGLALKSGDLPGLLRSWLRELLWLHEVEGLAFRGASFSTLEEGRLEARVRLAPPSTPPVREIKGVTFHGLEAGSDGETWRARVIFDV